MMESNFYAWLSEPDGSIVPGSHREGHNVFTEVGREWLRRLCVWTLPTDLSGTDEAHTDRRLRWVGVGSGYQQELVNVETLVSPLSILTGPAVYLRTLPTPSFPTTSSVKFSISFTGASADFDHHGASVSVSEAGLFADVHDGVATELNAGVTTNSPVAYKSFTALTKAAAQTLSLVWEFRF